MDKNFGLDSLKPCSNLKLIDNVKLIENIFADISEIASER